MGVKMSKINFLIFIVYALVMCLYGCANEQQVRPVEEICAGGVSKAEAIIVAEDVLGDMAFKIDKLDAEAGYIRTRPLGAGQWFEFWRKDNVGAFNHTEANLHTIRRTAEIEIDQQNGKVCVSCEVTAERLSLSDRPISGTSSAQGLFTRNKGAFQRLKFNRDQEKAWEDLGEDEQLSSLILKRIESQLKESK